MCNPLRRLHRSCRRFFCRYIGIHVILAEIRELKEETMAALDNLKASTAALSTAVAANTAAINDAIAKLGAPVSGVSDQDVNDAATAVQALADTVAADAARLAAAPVVTAP